MTSCGRGPAKDAMIAVYIPMCEVIGIIVVDGGMVVLAEMVVLDVDNGSKYTPIDVTIEVYGEE